MSLNNEYSSFADLARANITEFQAPGIVEWVTSQAGLNQKPLPVQRFILKLSQGEELDDTTEDIEIRDQFNENIIGIFTERQYYAYLEDFKRINIPYDQLTTAYLIEFLLAWGRRGSKSTTIGMILAYDLFKLLQIPNPQEYFGIVLTDPMTVTMTALGEDNAKKLFAKCRNMIVNSPAFKRHVPEPPSGSNLKIFTQNDLDNPVYDSEKGRIASIIVSASANTPGIRGDNNLFFICEEFAHFNQAGKSTRRDPLDLTVYQAIAPSIASFKHPSVERMHELAAQWGTPHIVQPQLANLPYGRGYILSSPNGRRGEFAKMFFGAFERGADSYTLATNIPTYEANPTIPSAFLRKAFSDNPATYDQEYGALFITSGTSWLKDFSLVYLSFDTRLKLLQAQPRFDRKYFQGTDFALSNDGTATALSYFEPAFEEFLDDPETWVDPNNGLYQGRVPLEFFRFTKPERVIELLSSMPPGRYVIPYAEVRYAGQPPWEEDQVIDQIKLFDWLEEINKDWPVKFAIFDQWAGALIQQLLHARNLTHHVSINFTEATNSQVYQNFSRTIYNRALILPHDPEIESDLMSLRVDIKARDLIKVYIPDHEGHDDLFDAMARSLFLTYLSVTDDQKLAEMILGKENAIAFKKGRGGLATNPLHKRSPQKTTREIIANRMAGRQDPRPSATR